MAPQHYPIVPDQNRDYFMELVENLRVFCSGLLDKNAGLPQANQIEKSVFDSFMKSFEQAPDPNIHNVNLIAHLVELASEAFDLVYSFFEQFETQYINGAGDVLQISAILTDLTCIRLVFSELNGLIKQGVNPQKIKERK